MKLFGKGEPATAAPGALCPSCRLPLTDPVWLLCPRCRTVLSTCDGCSACGKCAKGSTPSGGR